MFTGKFDLVFSNSCIYLMENNLVDKIVIHVPDKNSGHGKQNIEIYCKTVGFINIADEGSCCS